MKKTIKFEGIDDEIKENQNEKILKPNKEIVSFQENKSYILNNVNVDIRVVFLKLGNISIKDSKFSCEAFLEASWHDPNFSVKNSHNDEIQYSDKIHWNPRILIQNITSNSTQEIWYFVEKVKNGYKISERRRLKGDFMQTFNLKNFPFDLQELCLNVSSLRSSKEININLSKEKLSSVDVSAFTQTHEWVLYPAVGHLESSKQSYFSDTANTILDISVCISRKPTYYYWNSFLLSFIITLICFCCYAIRCDISGNRLIISITVLLTLITFKLSLSKYLPSLSYLTILDKYSLMSISIIFINCTYFAIMGVVTLPLCPFPYNIADNYAFYSSISLYFLLNIFIIIKIVILSVNNKRILEKRAKEHNLNNAGKRTRIKSIFQSSISDNTKNFEN